MTHKKSPQAADSKKYTDNSTATQRRKIHEAMKNNLAGMTTDEMRRDLDVMMPAARVHELRWNEGLNIVTYYETVETDSGNKHPGVARYVLMAGKWQGGAL